MIGAVFEKDSSGRGLQGELEGLAGVGGGKPSWGPPTILQPAPKEAKQYGSRGDPTAAEPALCEFITDVP